MKRLISLLLVLVMALSMAACSSTNNDNTTTAGTTAAPVVETSALEILENIWNAFGEDQKFPVMGGAADAYVDGAPGSVEVANTDMLIYTLLLPESQVNQIDEAASLMHGMMLNNFTAAAYHLTEGTDVDAFTAAVHETIHNNPWICGMPEQMLIAVVHGEYVVTAFGVNAAMDPFKTNLTAVYPETQIAYSESIA